MNLSYIFSNLYRADYGQLRWGCPQEESGYYCPFIEALPNKCPIFIGPWGRGSGIDQSERCIFGARDLVVSTKGLINCLFGF